MNFSTSIAELKRCMSIVKDIPSGLNASSPELSGLLLTADETTITVSATDGQLFVKQTLSAVVETKGSVLVPASLFCPVIEGLEGQNCHIKTDGKSLLISATNPLDGARIVQKRSLDLLDPESFPSPSSFEFPSDLSIEFSAKLLEKAFSKVSFAAASQTSRPAMRGTFLKVADNTLITACTDGIRLVEYTTPTPTGEISWECVLEPKFVSKAIKLLKSVGDFQLYIAKDDRRMFFAVRDVILAGSLIGHPFPDYREKIPKFVKKLVVNKNTLISAIHGIMPVVDHFNKQSKIILTSAHRVMAVHSVEKSNSTVTEGIPCGFDGEFDIALNGKTLIECLSKLESDTVAIKFIDSTKPAAFVDDADSTYFCLVAPLFK